MMNYKMTGCKYIDEYIKLVQKQDVPYSKWIYKLIDLVCEIFENEQLQWNDKEIEKYMSYQKYFDYNLFEWEKFLFVLHNCIRDEDNLLRFPEIFIYVGRGSGKNGYLSFEDFCLLTPTNPVNNYSLDICANSEEQAMTSFIDIKNILDNDKERFKRFFKWNKTEIKCLKNNNVLKYRTSNAKTKDGLRTGKLDLDECFTKDTEILTEKGFVKFEDLKDENVAQWDNGLISFVKPTRKIKRLSNEIVLNYLGNDKYLRTTKNHNIVYRNMNTNEVYTKLAIEKARNKDHVVLQGELKNENKQLTNEERLIICAQADGTIHTNKDQKDKQTRYLIAFSKDRKIKRFLDLKPNNLSLLKPNNIKQRFTFTLNTPYAKQLYKCFDIIDFDKNKAIQFIDEVCNWDGHVVSDNILYYSSTDKKNVDFVNAIAVLGGYNTYQSKQVDNRKDSYKDVHRLFIRKKATLQSSTFNSRKTVEQYNDFVYCVEVPSHKIVIRSQGKVLVCGNCHAYENYDMLDVMKTGLGKVKDSRITYISTNGFTRDGVLDDLLKKSYNILNKEAKDYGFLPFLCCLEDETEVKDHKNWHKANPSLRYLKTLQKEIEREYQDYLIDEFKNLSFMTKRMNYFKQAQEHLVATWEDILQTNKPNELQDGQNVILGIDFSKTTDFVGTFILGKCKDDYIGKQFSFFCNESKDKARINAPLEQFEKKGQMTIVKDVEIPVDIVMEYVRKVQSKYNILMLVVDNYRYSFLSSKLKELGFTKENNNLKMTRPSDIMGVTQKVNSVFINHKLSVGDDNLFRWFVNNTKLVPCKNNNYNYEKIEPKSRKNDGFMAFVNCMVCSDLLEENQLEFFKPICL